MPNFWKELRLFFEDYSIFEGEACILLVSTELFTLCYAGFFLRFYINLELKIHR